MDADSRRTEGECVRGVFWDQEGGVEGACDITRKGDPGMAVSGKGC